MHNVSGDENTFQLIEGTVYLSALYFFSKSIELSPVRKKMRPVDRRRISDSYQNRMEIAHFPFHIHSIVFAFLKNEDCSNCNYGSEKLR